MAPTTAPSFTIDVADVGTGLGVLVRGADFTLNAIGASTCVVLPDADIKAVEIVYPVRGSTTPSASSTSAT